MYNKIIYSLFTIFLTPTLLHSMEEKTLVAAAAAPDTIEAIDWKEAFQKKHIKEARTTITVVNKTKTYIQVILDRQVSPTKEGPWTLLEYNLVFLNPNISRSLTLPFIVGVQKNPSGIASMKYIYIQKRSLRFKTFGQVGDPFPIKKMEAAFEPEMSPPFDIEAHHTYFIRPVKNRHRLEISIEKASRK